MRSEEATMERDAKIHLQPEHSKKRKGDKPLVQSQKSTTPNPANLTRSELQHMSPADIIRLSGIIGNKAVGRLMAQRQEEEEEEVVEGARSKPLREDSAQQRAAPGLRSSPAQRASPSSSATGEIGDAVDLDGEGLYGWNRITYASDIATVINGVIPTTSSEEEMPRIVVFSGTHGTDPGGHLVNDAASRDFVAEDQATANAAMAANPGVEVEVIDVVTSYGTKADLTSVYGMTDYIRVLGWCFSQRSYGLGDSIKSNWWPEPDSL
jgi:hypothetical protein